MKDEITSAKGIVEKCARERANEIVEKIMPHLIKTGDPIYSFEPARIKVNAKRDKVEYTSYLIKYVDEYMQVFTPIVEDAGYIVKRGPFEDSSSVNGYITSVITIMVKFQ